MVFDDWVCDDAMFGDGVHKCSSEWIATATVDGWGYAAIDVIHGRDSAMVLRKTNLSKTVKQSCC